MARAPWPPILQDWAHPSLSSKHWAGPCRPKPRHKVKQKYSPAIIMPTPRRGWQDIPLAEEMPDTSHVTLHRNLPPAFMVNVGNPHAVIFVESGTAGLAAQYGFELEKNRLLPHGANVNFAACTGDKILLSWTHGSAAPG